MTTGRPSTIRWAFRLCFLAMQSVVLLGCADDECPTCPSTGRAVQVRADGTGQYRTIQDAIDAAASGDTIVLGRGTYSGARNTDLVPGGRSLAFRSEDDDFTSCTIDCAGDSSHPHRAFDWGAVDAPQLLVRGITIANGHVASSGGAIFSPGPTRVTIINCRFASCQTTDSSSHEIGGGAIAVSGDLTIETSSFSHCAGSTGGAIWASGDDVRVSRCSFESNRASILGGAIALYVPLSGGNAWPARCIVDSCSFEGNHSDSQGGAIWAAGNPVIIRACTFTGNADVDGGAVYLGGTTRLMSCSFGDDDNADMIVIAGMCELASCQLEAMRCAGSQEFPSSARVVLCGIRRRVWLEERARFAFYVCNMSYASVVVSAGAHVDLGNVTCYSCFFDVAATGSATLWNCIVDRTACSDGAEIAMWCSDIYECTTEALVTQIGQNGNFAADPLYCDVAGGDFRLRSDSPCLQQSCYGLIGGNEEGSCGPEPRGRR